MQQNVLDLFKVVIYLSTEKKMHHLKVSYVLFSDLTENLAWDTGSQRALRGTYLVVQWLRLHTFTASSTGSIPGWGTKIPHAMGL